jgi:hypothetical protein
LQPRHRRFFASSARVLTNLSAGCTCLVLIKGASTDPLYAARLEDLTLGDLLQLECVCGHSEQLTPTTPGTAGVNAFEKLAEPALPLRCRECDDRGRAVVPIRWGPAHAGCGWQSIIKYW